MIAQKIGITLEEMRARLLAEHNLTVGLGTRCGASSTRATSGLLPVSRTPGLGVKVKPEVLHAASQVRA